MMMKRILSILLVLAMFLSLFVGCGKKDKDVSKGVDSLVVGIPQKTTIPDYDTNKFTVFMEERTGINIKFFYFASSPDHYKQQLTLMGSSGEKLPDVMFLTLDHYYANQLGEDGLFMDISQLLDEHGTNFNKALGSCSKSYQKYIKTKLKNTNSDAIYGLPQIREDWFMDDMQSQVYINKVWLDELNLKVPGTIAELETVCNAFLTKDPNKNGKQDEIAMLGSGNLINWLINAYVEYEDANWNVKDGKVWDPRVTPEFRQALQKINDFKESGLFNILGLTTSDKEKRNLISPITGEEGKVGIFGMHHEIATNESTDTLADYVALGPLADETGKGGYTILNSPPFEMCAYIGADCKDPVTAMKFIDAFIDDDVVSFSRFGVEGVDWVREKGTNAYGDEAYVKQITTNIFFDGSTNTVWGITFPYLVTTRNHMPIVTEDTSQYAQEVNRLHSEQYHFIETAKKRESLDALIYTQEEYDIREEKSGLLNSYLNSQIQLFVAGEVDISDDKAWDDFKKTLTKLGNEPLMKVAQDAYNRQLKK